MPEDSVAKTPFETIESALEFIVLLQAEADSTRNEIVRLMDDEQDTSSRRVEALRLVVHKLKQLTSYLESSERVLHDLQSLRALLLR